MRKTEKCKHHITGAKEIQLCMYLLLMEINWSSFSVCEVLVIRDENKITIEFLMVKRFVMFGVGKLHDPSALKLL
jgi:hypothetical protein